MAIGVGLGAQAAVFGALLHMTYHSLAKPVALLFRRCALSQLHSSSNFDRSERHLHQGAGRQRLFWLAPSIITGSPPFGLFFS